MDTAARLYTSSFVLKLAHFNAACHGSETKFVATRSQSVPRLCSTHSRCKSLLFGDCQTSSAYPLAPVGFLTEIHTTNKARQIDAGGEHNRRHTGTHTHTQTRCKEQPRIPKWCSLHEHPDGTIYHSRTAANLTTLHWWHLTYDYSSSPRRNLAHW